MWYKITDRHSLNLDYVKCISVSYSEHRINFANTDDEIICKDFYTEEQAIEEFEKINQLLGSK